jgi:hypothetical protein
MVTCFVSQHQPIVSFAEKAFQVSLNPSWISRFMKRYHFSLQRPSSMSKVELNDERRLEAIEFIKEVRRLRKNPDQIVCLDKTSFYHDARFIRNISMKGGERPRRLNMPRGKKDVVYTALVANGTVSKLYIEAPDGKSVRKEKPLKRGETGMIDWCSEQFSEKFLFAGDLVLVDSEKALSTENVTDLMSSRGVMVKVFPPGLGKLMNPCDAYFHSMFKRNYYRKVHLNIDTVAERKYEFMRQA